MFRRLSVWLFGDVPRCAGCRCDISTPFLLANSGMFGKVWNYDADGKSLCEACCRARRIPPWWHRKEFPPFYASEASLDRSEFDPIHLGA